jgi:hypothetical protein
MRWHALWFLALIWIGCVNPTSAQPPPAYALRQNDPEPFCGSTRIDLALPVAAEVSLFVWNPDSTQVIRTLIQGRMTAGYHSVIWDGLDDHGSSLAGGSYPYVMTAVEVPGQPPAFTASLRATIDCPTSMRVRSWGAVRGMYRHPAS